MGGACSTYGERRDVHKVLVGKPEGKCQLVRPRRRLEGNNNNNGSLGIGCGDKDGIDLAQDRDKWRALVNAGMNLRVS
jgi:hypothetical protein